jgi:hypothetical protein
MSATNIFGKICKAVENGDGTLYVEGIASTEQRDPAGELIKADAIRKAIPSYLRADGTGPLREMHQFKAAGKTVELHVDEAGVTHIAAIVVDPLAITKVKTGVYQGFSVGGQSLKRNSADKRIIEEMRLDEISLVDAGETPGTTGFTLVKCTGASMPEKSTHAAVDPTSPSAVADAAANAAAPSAPAADAQTTPDVAKAAGAAPADAKPAEAPAAPAVSPAEPAPKSAARDAIRKAVGTETWDAKTAIDALQSLQMLLGLEQGEDHPEAKAQLADLLGAIEKLKAFIASEILEKAPGECDQVAAAAKPGDILKAVHDQLADCSAKLATLTQAEETIAKAAQAGDIQKRVSDAEDAASQAGEALAKVLGERDALATENAQLRAQVETKGVLKAVGKDQDVGGTAPEAKDEPTDTHSLIRKAQGKPFRLIG